MTVQSLELKRRRQPLRPLIGFVAGYDEDRPFFEKPAELIRGAEDDVRRYMAPYGLVVERLYWASNVRLPDTVLAQINAKIANEQAALAAQAKVAQAKADAEATRLRGSAEADAIKAKTLALSSNPMLIELTKAERWDGKLPTTVLPNGTLPFIDASK